MYVCRLVSSVSLVYWMNSVHSVAFSNSNNCQLPQWGRLTSIFIRLFSRVSRLLCTLFSRLRMLTKIRTKMLRQAARFQYI